MILMQGLNEAIETEGYYKESQNQPQAQINVPEMFVYFAFYINILMYYLKWLK